MTGNLVFVLAFAIDTVFLSLEIYSISKHRLWDCANRAVRIYNHLSIDCTTTSYIHATTNMADFHRINNYMALGPARRTREPTGVPTVGTRPAGRGGRPDTAHGRGDGE